MAPDSSQRQERRQGPSEGSGRVLQSQEARSSLKARMSDQREKCLVRGGWVLRVGGRQGTSCQRQEPEARRQV